MKRFLFLGFLALAGCEGYDASGQWREGIPSTSGYYVDPARQCVRVGQTNNGVSGYHARELVTRMARGEKMCPESEAVGELARRIARKY